MAINASRGGYDAPAYSSSHTMGDKGSAGVSMGHRSLPVENQGLLARMDEAKDNVSDGDYDNMLRAAAAHPSCLGCGDGGADAAQDEFERRHDRRQGSVQTHAYEGGPRLQSSVERIQQDRGIDSQNFPASKDW